MKLTPRANASMRRLGFLTTEGAIGEFITSEEELGHVLPPLFFYIMWVPGGFLIGIARVRPTRAFSLHPSRPLNVVVSGSAQIAFMSVACGALGDVRAAMPVMPQQLGPAVMVQPAAPMVVAATVVNPAAGAAVEG